MLLRHCSLIGLRATAAPDIVVFLLMGQLNCPELSQTQALRVGCTLRSFSIVHSIVSVRKAVKLRELHDAGMHAMFGRSFLAALQNSERGCKLQKSCACGQKY